MLFWTNPTPFVFTAQPAGIPEILKKSLHSCSVRGGEEVFIIGKNFLKDTKVIFQENVAGETHFSHLGWFYLISLFNSNHSTSFFVPDEKSWKAEAEIDMELFHQVDRWVVFIYTHDSVPHELSI